MSSLFQLSFQIINLKITLHVPQKAGPKKYATIYENVFKRKLSRSFTYLIATMFTLSLLKERGDFHKKKKKKKIMIMIMTSNINLRAGFVLLMSL